jgi:hypothetical protein
MGRMPNQEPRGLHARGDDVQRQQQVCSVCDCRMRNGKRLPHARRCARGLCERFRLRVQSGCLHRQVQACHGGSRLSYELCLRLDHELVYADRMRVGWGVCNRDG